MTEEDGYGTLKVMSGVENVAGFDLGNIVSQNSLIFSSLEFLFQFLPVFGCFLSDTR